MEIKSFESELNLIIKAIHQHPVDQITGAVLGTLIKNTAKSLNIREVVEMPFGAGALTKFISLYLSDHLNQTGKKGGDVLYTIIGDGTQTASKTYTPPSGESEKRLSVAARTTSVVQTIPPNIWAVFINPVKKYSIYLNRSEMTLSVIAHDNNFQAHNLVPIDNLTQEELQSIQSEFMALIAQGKEGNPLIIRLRAATSNSDWFSILKSSCSPDYKSWLVFRRQRIEELFADRLRKLSLDEDAVKHLAGILMDTQYHAAQTSYKKNIEKTPPLFGGGISSYTKTDEHQFRQGLIAAISEMSIEDLRKLSLPYGVVYDSLNKLHR